MKTLSHRLLFFPWMMLSGALFAAEDTRPNILMIVAEDMSSRLGAYSDPVARTPHIDALAGQGIQFTNVFTAAGVCAPSRAALMMGRNQISFGAHQMRTSNGPVPYETVPPPQMKAFPELLRRAGYLTANFAKRDYQFGEPFSLWDADIGDFGSTLDASLWRHLPEGQPFFAMVNLMWTHESRLFPADTQASGPFAGLLEDYAERREALIEHVTDPADVDVPPYFPDTPAVRQMIAQHYDNIHFMDSQVGRILNNLAQDGLADNTIVIWTTDHGDAFPRAKRAVYDSGLHVPMIMRFPDGRGAGTVSDKLISFVDLGPTILSLAGVEIPETMLGFDFLSAQERDYIYAARDRMDMTPDRVRAARDKRYKYIRNMRSDLAYFRPLAFRDAFPIMQDWWQGHEAGTLNSTQDFYFQQPRPEEELYDTQADPHEVNNLAGDEDSRGILERMRTALGSWLERVGDYGDMDELDMIDAMWPGREQPVTAAPEILVSDNAGGTMVSLRSATEGASIGYRFMANGQPTAEGWQLYTQAFALPDDLRVEAKAIRYGYAESAVSRR